MDVKSFFQACKYVILGFRLYTNENITMNMIFKLFLLGVCSNIMLYCFGFFQVEVRMQVCVNFQIFTFKHLCDATASSSNHANVMHD